MVQGMAVLDCLLSLARVAKRGGWVRPEMLRGAHAIDIVGGRHPMVEATIGGSYVPNDVRLSHDSQARTPRPPSLCATNSPRTAPFPPWAPLRPPALVPALPSPAPPLEWA